MWRRESVLLAELYNGGLARVKAQAEENNVTWDVLDAVVTDAEPGCVEGLLEEGVGVYARRCDGSTPEDDFFGDALHNCGVANYLWASVYAHDKDASPGTRGLRRGRQANLEWALMTGGVALADICDVLSTLSSPCSMVSRTPRPDGWPKPPAAAASGRR